MTKFMNIVLIGMMLLTGCASKNQAIDVETETSDTTKPVITLKAETVNVVLGKDYETKDNVKSVTDDTDGTLKYSEKVTKDEAYYIVEDKDVNTSKEGTYKVKVTASDKAGNVAEKEFGVVVAKENTEEKKSNIKDNAESKATTPKDTEPSTTNPSAKKSSVAVSNVNTSSKNSTNVANESQIPNNSSVEEKRQKCTQVIHYAEGHYETVVTGQRWVEDTPAKSYQDGYECNSCGQFFGNIDAAYDHAIATMDAGDCSHTFHSHYAFEEATGHYEDVTTEKYVIDKDGYYETVCE